MPSNWTKQPQQLLAKYFNSGSGDAVEGGLITGVPAGVAASQGSQTRVGDRLVLGAVDALAMSDLTVGTLYNGLYQYVQTSASTATPTLGHLAFWDTSVADSLYRVTPDETDAMGVENAAGVYINTLTKGYYWWIQIAGRATAVFANPLTGAPAIGSAVYAAAVGAGNPGVFDVLDGGGNPSFTQVGQMQARRFGVARALPVAGAASTIQVPLRNVRF